MTNITYGLREKATCTGDEEETAMLMSTLQKGNKVDINDAHTVLVTLERPYWNRWLRKSVGS